MEKGKKPQIAVGVFGGIVTNVFVKGIDDVDVTVLDVDKEREDAELVEKKWDEIAAGDSGYRDVPLEFYAPLDGED